MYVELACAETVQQNTATAAAVHGRARGGLLISNCTAMTIREQFNLINELRKYLKDGKICEEDATKRTLMMSFRMGGRRSLL